MKPVRSRRLRLAVALATCGICASAWSEDFLDDWEVNGSNTLRLEHYRVRGDPNSGPYRFDGGQYFDEFNLNFVRRLSAFDTVRGQFYGVANDSAYRAQDHGVVPERVNVTREKGDGSLPYRAEAGDFFAYFSYRTLQRPLKGAQVELQPQPSENGIRHSVVLVSGVDQPNWRHLHAKDNWTNGVSWLIELGPQARFSANVLHNSRQADAALGTPDRKQTVASLTGDYGWQWASNRLRLEGEVAGLRGDHDGYLDARGATDPASGRDRRGQGAFAQFSGAGLTTPLDYRLRFERYDRDFRPVEAVISPDRRSEEAHIGWRFAEGLSLRGRALQYVDALQSGNDLKTTTYGVNLAGAFFAGMGGSIDLFWQELLKRDSSIDRGVWNTNANFTKPLPNQWVGNLGLFWQQVHDRVPGAGDTRSAQVQLGATHALNLGGWYGTFTPGITLRRARGASSGVTEVSPALAFALTRNAHSVGASYGYQRLRPDVTSLATIDVNMLRVDYRYTRGRDTFGVEAFAYDRRVTVGEFNDTYRLSVFWTHLLDKPARAAPRLVAVAMPDASAPLPRDVGVLLAVSPGADLAASLRRLEDAGYRGGVAQGNVVVFESRLLNEIDQRQRLAVEHDAGRVARVGLVVSIEDPNNAPAIAQTYERVRKALLDRYGAPALTFEEGAIGPTFVADLNAGRIIRAMEWQTDTGKLRLGIPRRLDGQVRIEIQHAPAFNSPRDALWSLESVR